MMNKKIKKSKRPLQVKLMIAVTVIAVLVIIPLTSNIMEDVFRITGRQKGYSEETLFQCFIDNEYGMLTDKIEYNKGVGRKITKEEENYIKILSEEVENPALQEMLKKLGRSVISNNKGEKKKDEV